MKSPPSGWSHFPRIPEAFSKWMEAQSKWIKARIKSIPQQLQMITAKDSRRSPQAVFAVPVEGGASCLA
jgi:hypothetical protein